MNALFRYFDRNGDGVIDFEEFIAMIQIPLNQRRQQIVDKLISQYQKNHSRYNNLGECKIDMNVLSENCLFRNNSERWDAFIRRCNVQSDGTIQAECIYNYYRLVSLEFINDDDFVN